MDKVVEAKQRIEKMLICLESEEGKTEARKAMELVSRTIIMLRKERQLNHASMYEPLGPIHPSGLWPQQRA